MCADSRMKSIIYDATRLVKYSKRTGLNFKHRIVVKSYCKTRWSTVYMMLQSIVNSYGVIFDTLARRQNSDKREHRNCFDRIECLKKSTLLKIVEFLKPFKEWTDRIEGDTRITLHHVWSIFIQMNDHLQMPTDFEN